MSSKIQKWGNSAGVRIPKTIMEKANLDLNSKVEIECKNKKIIICSKKKPLHLKELLSKITKDNLHKEDNYVKVGKELW
ncbi:MAG: AbrB/MazE/SpoVT family DNA-binding domain-containing protein [Bdellovibrionaceae bacterium]|nr:AbrB/MazE/SpoVT family DNA-binding domain-containing protein [Pseudobdellovibrionaceae bacterium]